MFEFWVEWRDKASAEIYGSGPGPFQVVHVKKDTFAPECTCGGKGGGLLDDGHSPRCGIRKTPAEENVYILQMSGRLCSLPASLFKTIPSLRRR